MKNTVAFIFASILASSTLVGCTSSSNNPDNGVDGGIGGSGDDDSGNSLPEGDCAGSFAKIDKSYALNTALGDVGGFYVDAKGMVFGLLPDPRQLDDVTSLPYLIQTATLDGKASTVYTFPKGAIMLSVHADATSIYFLGGGYKIDGSIFRIPREGGTPQAVYTPAQGTIGDFIMDDANLYFAIDDTVFSIAKTGGTLRTVAVRKGSKIDDLVIDGGNLYWGEQPQGTLDPSDTSMWKLAPSDDGAKPFGTVPAATPINQIGVSNDVLVFSTIENDSSLQLYTMKNGAAPVKVDDKGGNPLTVHGTDVFYNSYSGLKQLAIAGGTAAVVTSSSIPYMSAVTLTDSEIYYATETCLFRQAK